MTSFASPNANSTTVEDTMIKVHASSIIGGENYKIPVRKIIDE